MPTPEIIQKVRELHAELGETRPTPLTQAEIDRMKQAVELVIREPDHMPHYKSLNDRILFAVVGFQIDHPKLFDLMTGVAASLSNAGI